MFFKNKLNNPYGLEGDEYELILNFWQKYRKSYDRVARKSLKAGLLPEYELELCRSLFVSVYDHLGILDEDRNYYELFLCFLKDYFPNLYDKAMLEVACGRFPNFVEKIANEISKNNASGSIVGMDQNVIIPSIANTTLIKERFSLTTDISKYELLLGLFPCEAIPTMLKKACLEQKELAILMCECLHDVDKVSFASYETYLDHLYSMVKTLKSSDFNFDINYLNDIERFSCPILSLKRK